MPCATTKTVFRELGIPVSPFAAVDTRADLERATARIGLPAVLKTRTLGYDGKGQALLRNAGDLDAAWARLGAARLILEGFVPFDREVSVIAVRGRNGETLFYPLTENTHQDLQAGLDRLLALIEPKADPDLGEPPEVAKVLEIHRAHPSVYSTNRSL